MKKVANRGKFALLLSLALVVGLGVFLVSYVANGGAWVIFPGSPHVYSGGNLSVGVITDREGTVLLDATDGREYSDDAALREATLHWFGDRQGFIGAPMLGEFADEMVGYNPVTGIYSLGDDPAKGTLTMDASLQRTALEALEGYAGTVAVYNYETGEILCAVTTPTYDPDNVPDIDGDTSGQYGGVYVNRLMNATYTPGSVFKIVTLAAALEKLEDLETKTFTCTGSVNVDGTQVNCNGVHGTVDVSTGFAKSCNVVFAELALELGGETLDAYAEKMGITTSYEMDGYITKAGNVTAADAQSVDVAWAGIGQYTDQISPYGFLQMMGAIAGGGTAKQAYLFQSVNDKEVADPGTVSVELLPETCRALAEMMGYNTEAVYGSYRFGGLDVCAKSGTAEVGAGLTPHAVFAGFSQDEAYPIAFFALVEHGGSGSQVAGDVVGEILTAMTQ